MSHPTLFVAALLAVVVALSLAFLLRRAASRGRFQPVTAEWIHELSPEKYRPMERLLKEDDFRFLRSQPGVNASLARKLRAERRSIFRRYLGLLKRDFHRVCDGVRMLMLGSRQDRPDLAAALLKQRLAFTLGLTAVHVRLLMHAAGWGAVDTRELVDALDAMRRQFQQLALAPAPVGAAA